MTTEKQIIANRQNALLAGPKTVEGKIAGRLHAVSHGLLSKEVLLPGENKAQLEELRENNMAELQPVGEFETFLVDRIVCAKWRLARGLKIELHAAVTLPSELVKEKSAIIGGDYRYGSWQNYIRYETAIERQLYKAKHELERCQRMRQGENLPPPIAIDVDVPDPAEN
jgi:hypothetical protein